MGVALGARARIQLNLAVSQVVDIKQVATFPDIVFPIMWFEDVSNELIVVIFLIFM
jgi:CD36 family.